MLPEATFKINPPLIQYKQEFCNIGDSYPSSGIPEVMMPQ